MSIHVHHLHQQFAGSGEVLRDISLDIAAGDFVTLLGPSGCGKSTLLRLMLALETPTSGELLMDGRPPAEVPGRSCVFQEPRLLPWRTAAANTALPLELAQVPRAERAALVQAALALVGLAESAHLYPSQLSGGMRMRVSLARALITKPRYLLLDEPFGALDEITRENLNDELLRLWQADRWTAVFVTHNVFEAVFLSQRIVVLGRRPGVVAATVPVPFAYPRGDDLRGSPEFARLVGEVMQHLHRVAT